MPTFGASGTQVAVCFRNQVDLLRSRLNHDLKTFYAAYDFSKVTSLDDLLFDTPCTYPWCMKGVKCHSQCGIRGKKTYSPLFFRYDEILCKLREVFGNRLHVLIYEKGIFSEYNDLLETLGIEEPLSSHRENTGSYELELADILQLIDRQKLKEMDRSNRKFNKMIEPNVGELGYYFTEEFDLPS